MGVPKPGLGGGVIGHCASTGEHDCPINTGRFRPCAVIITSSYRYVRPATPPVIHTVINVGAVSVKRDVTASPGPEGATMMERPVIVSPAVMSRVASYVKSAYSDAGVSGGHHSSGL